MHEPIIQRAGDIIQGRTGGGNEGYCALALISPEGYPTVSTISISKADGIKWLTFCTGLGSKDARIKHSNKAGVCVNSEEYNISLIGTIEIITTPEVKKDMWYDGLEHHFSGWDDPNYCVLKFTTEQYNLFVDWQSARGAL